MEWKADKISLRKEGLKRRQALSPQVRREKSRQIKEIILGLPEYKESRVLFSYVSHQTEVDTHEIIKESLKAGKCVAVPISIKETHQLVPSEIRNFDTDLKVGAYSILEPKFKRIIPKTRLDLVLVPGILFDKRGYRIGYGGGFFDRFLKELPERSFTLGLCFSCQRVALLPVEEHDVPVKGVVTEYGLSKVQKLTGRNFLN
jgi:5-formyltetrahydrofolate cyclo-ligase